MKTYTLGGGWGDRIEFFPSWISDSEKQTVCGWKQRIPKVGDILSVEMRSGSIALFKFTSVDRKSDPPDMFFADVEFAEYE